ncbi:MAG: DUF433 domain-containing protein [Armatimonadetes bacterium]|nr:DUF433 domain-containing protein [Armatimonadota bacterium]
MNDEQLLERIAIDPKVMLGKPVIKGTRLTVEYIIDRLAHEASMDDLIREYEGLAADDILACLLFARKSLSETDYLPLLAEAS